MCIRDRCKKCIKVYRVFQQPSRPKPVDEEESSSALQGTESVSNRGGGRSRRPRNHNSQTFNLALIDNVAGELGARSIRTRARSATAEGDDTSTPGDSSNTKQHSSDPPTYDEVVQSPYVPNIPYADDEDERAQPPPYSPTMC